MIGQRLLHYEILEKLGEGGMGVVYKARDAHLDRTVAIKVIRTEAVANTEGKRRFVQEARSASALNHPNILHIYDIAQAGAIDFIAMEYVEGKTLDCLIGRKGLPLHQALSYGVQIAGALAKVHAVGIVHRDLKPTNIMVTGDGVVKLLDFGLAKLTESSQAGLLGSTATMAVQTVEGTIVGSLPYMSPEQACGHRVDARSDIFSFGSLLYEMITGRQAFHGETPLATLSAIADGQPQPVSTFAPDTPPELEKLIARCIQKDPERRIQHLGDAKLALEELKEDSASGRLSLSTRAGFRTPQWAIPAFLFAILLAGASWWNRWLSQSTSGRVLTRLTSDAGLTTDPALSPDGQLLAFASDRSGEGNLDIYIQQVRGGEAIRLTRHPSDDREPAFSPDGTKIVFRSNRDGGGVYLISSLGGGERLIARYGRRPVFSPDGNSIVYWTGALGEPRFPYRGKIFVKPTTGGEARQFQEAFQTAWAPVWSPDGKHILFQGARDWGSRSWYVAPIDGAAVTTIDQNFFRKYGLGDPTPIAWLAKGNRVVFSASSGDAINLWQVAISPDTWKVRGSAEQLTFGAGQEEHAAIAVLPNATIRLVYSSLIESVNIWALPLEPHQGSVTGSLLQLTQTGATDGAAVLTSDGRKLIFGSTRSGTGDIWAKDLVTGKETRLTDTPSREWRPVTTADGTRIAYKDNRTGGIHVMDLVWGADGARPGFTRKISTAEPCGYPWSWSSDRRMLLFNCPTPGPVYLFDIESNKATKFLNQGAFSVEFSPDDRWVAWLANPGTSASQSEMFSGRDRGFIAAFNGQTVSPEKDWLTMADALVEGWLKWAPDGKSLYFFSTSDGFRCIWSQPVDPDTKKALGKPFAIYHSHGSRRSLLNISVNTLSLSVGSDKMVFPLAESIGNVWMAEETNR